MKRPRPVAACMVIAIGLTAGCASHDTRDVSRNDAAHDDEARFRTVDAEVRRMVADYDLPGAALRVRVDDEVLHELVVGTYSPSTAVPSASASKWLTAATVMTLVDDGLVSLDAPISDYLDGLDGAVAHITLRQLLSHTSGLPDGHPCPGSPAMTLAACARAILGGGLAHAPGAFAYGSPGYTVAGYVAETVTGRTWSDLFTDRIARPLGMERTTWGDIRGRPTDNPDPGAGATTTLDDYSAFLAMLLDDGVHDGHRVLQQRSVHAIEEPEVALPGQQRWWYGLGTHETELDDGTTVVSSAGVFGFRPWLERDRELAAVLVIDRMSDDVPKERAGDGPLHRAVRRAVDALR